MLSENDLILKSFGSFKLYLDKTDPGLSRALLRPKIFRKWHREPEFMDIIEKEVNTGDVVFDLGANLGYVTMFLAQYVGPTGMVYAAEPSPRNAHILSKTILKNNLSEFVELTQCAISSITGVRDLNIAAESNLNSFAKTKYTVNSIPVKTFSIDDFFSNRRFPNFIKMDIEGAEVDALKGLDIILKNNSQPIKILMEIHPMYYDGDEFAKQIIRLFENGFFTKYLVTAGTACPSYFSSKGYRPVKTYKSGDWTRGVYMNVAQEHVLESTCNMFHDHEVYINWSSVLKNPRKLFNRRVSNPKLVRCIMLERP